jgi:hypothetical protein
MVMTDKPAATQEAQNVLSELLAKAESGQNLTAADMQKLADVVRPSAATGVRGKAVAGQTCDSYC